MLMLSFELVSYLTGRRRSSDANFSFVSLGSLKKSEAASRAQSMTD